MSKNTASNGSQSLLERWLFWAVLLSISVVLNLLLARKVQTVRQQLEAAVAQLTVQEGDAVPPLNVLDENNKEIRISYSDQQRPTVLYFMSRHCSWCTRNTANMNAVALGAKDRYRLFAISLDDDNPALYARDRGTVFPVYYRPTETAPYKLGGTPQTIVVSPEGKVVRSWHGAYYGSLMNAVEEFLQLKLPGLSAPATKERTRPKEQQAAQ